MPKVRYLYSLIFLFFAVAGFIICALSSNSVQWFAYFHGHIPRFIACYAIGLVLPYLYVWYTEKQANDPSVLVMLPVVVGIIWMFAPYSIATFGS